MGRGGWGGGGGGVELTDVSLGGITVGGHLDALTSIIARWCHCWEQSRVIY